MEAPRPTKAWAATRAALAHSLGEIDGVLPGSVVVRRISCGKPGCGCKTGPDAGHGPYIQWTRSVGARPSPATSPNNSWRATSRGSTTPAGSTSSSPSSK